MQEGRSLAYASSSSGGGGGGGRAELLNLNSDVLRSIASYLPPADRVALSRACKTLYRATWASFGLRDLLARFPFERRLVFALAPGICTRYRRVPERAAQSHVAAAVADDGRRAAVLAYDNVLRIVDTHNCRVLHAVRLDFPCVRFDTWDNHMGVRRAPPRPHPAYSYADAAAIDCETTLQFTKQGYLLLATPTRLVLYDIANDGALQTLHDLPAAPMLSHLRAQVANLDTPPCDGIAASAVISPDGKRLAWIMYAGWPARAYATHWMLAPIPTQAPVCTAFLPLGVIPPARTSALAWARPTFHGSLVLVALNSTLRRLDIERVGDTFRRHKLCRFHFFACRFPHTGYRRHVSADAECSDWLRVSPIHFPASIAEHLRVVAASAGAEEDDATPVGLDALHTCPAESTYKALEFGDNTKHPWFVSKGPCFGLHFCSPNRVLVASAAQENAVGALVRNANQPFVRTDAAAVRRFAFHGLPWRASFAAVCAFAPSGRWLVAAALNDDSCYVCVRNVTVKEYTGVEPSP